MKAAKETHRDKEEHPLSQENEEINADEVLSAVPDKADSEHIEEPSPSNVSSVNVSSVPK